MKTNKFHYTFPLLLCFVYFEFWLFLFSFQLPTNKKEAEGSIFIYTLPSNSMVRRSLPKFFSESELFQVFLSLLTSLVVEAIKKRESLHRLVYPHHHRHSSLEYEGQRQMIYNV